MSTDNFRLAEHQVEMKLLGEDMDTIGFMRFENPENGSAYLMPEEKWKTSKEPSNIVITVTAIVPTSEPANNVDVVSSVESSADPEFIERNPSFDKA